MYVQIETSLRAARQSSSVTEAMKKQLHFAEIAADRKSVV